MTTSEPQVIRRLMVWMLDRVHKDDADAVPIRDSPRVVLTTSYYINRLFPLDHGDGAAASFFFFLLFFFCCCCCCGCCCSCFSLQTPFFDCCTTRYTSFFCEAFFSLLLFAVLYRPAGTKKEGREPTEKDVHLHDISRPFAWPGCGETHS